MKDKEVEDIKLAMKYAQFDMVTVDGCKYYDIDPKKMLKDFAYLIKKIEELEKIK